MAGKRVLTLVLAVVGTLLAAAPLVLTAAITLAGGIGGRRPNFDYLMPAELFPAALLGGGLLLWAALRARAQRGLIGWSLGVAIGALVASQAYAIASGLASGATEPGGLAWALVLAGIGIYTLALFPLAGGGIALLRALLRPAGRG